MKKLNGMFELIENQNILKGAGWIFVKSINDLRTLSAIIDAIYYIADDDDEEIDMEDTHKTFLEFGIFKGVIELEEKSGRKSVKDVAAGCLYYLENDTFRD